MTPSVKKNTITSKWSFIVKNEKEFLKKVQKGIDAIKTGKIVSDKEMQKFIYDK
jgi:hypothetical protein